MFAYIEKSGLFYSGEIPGISFGTAKLCDSYEECFQKLKEIAGKERNSEFFKPPRVNPHELQRKHPKAWIIKL